MNPSTANDFQAARDIRGFRVFSEGSLGRAHAAAHRMLDARCYELGHRRLQAWLLGRTGEGSQWVHLQWHMLVFEIAVQRPDAARQRFLNHILPAAASGDAMTDAPAALWRLSLAGRPPSARAWQVVRDAAVDQLSATDDLYVTLHHLLAIAGAGDVASLDQWLSSFAPRSATERILLRLARGLREFAAGNYGRAAWHLAAGLPGVETLGGSAAQNQLLGQVYLAARSRGAANDNRA